MKGRMFVQFIALIIASGMKQTMEVSGLVSKYSLPEIISEMKSFQRIVFDGKKKPVYSRLTKSQSTILTAFGLNSNSYV